jgi:8-oxo-dGTP diphosphatase
MPGKSNYQVLLVKRGGIPFQGMYALPGGFIDMKESLEEAAARELLEETGLKNIQLKQIYTFSQPDRDPRGRILSTCYAGTLPSSYQGSLQAGSDASELKWFHLSDLPALAFDHNLIIEKVIQDYLTPDR